MRQHITSQLLDAVCTIRRGGTLQQGSSPQRNDDGLPTAIDHPIPRGGGEDTHTIPCCAQHFGGTSAPGCVGGSKSSPAPLFRPCLVAQPKIFRLSHRIFGHMHRKLNVHKKNKLIIQFDLKNVRRIF
jgi:hypothetical protein